MVAFVIVNPQGKQTSQPNKQMFLLTLNMFVNRDTFIYAASIETSALDTAIKVLGEVVLRPRLSPEEVVTITQS